MASPGVSGTSDELSETPFWPYSLSVPAPLFLLGVSGTFIGRKSEFTNKIGVLFFYNVFQYLQMMSNKILKELFYLFK